MSNPSHPLEINYLTVLSPEALVQVDARWSDACEAMFEFLAAHYPQDLLKLVSGKVLAPTDMTFAAEIAGRTPNGPAVRAALMPLLDHESPLVREGATYGLRDHADEWVVKKLRSMITADPSPAIRRAAGATVAKAEGGEGEDDEGASGEAPTEEPPAPPDEGGP